MEENGLTNGDYPLFLGLSYFILVGYLARTVALGLRLPGATGVLLTGAAFQWFAQSDIVAARSQIQACSRFLVLTKAGFVMRLRDVSRSVLLFAWLPLTLEGLGLSLYACLVLKWSVLEALVLGTVLSGVGEGVIVPKMTELGRAFPGHPMPRLVFSCVPLEAPLVMAVLGLLWNFAVHDDQTVGVCISNGVISIVLTLVMGSAVGTLAGLLIPRRTQLLMQGRQVFTGSAVEAFVLFVGVAMGTYGIAQERPSGEFLLSMGITPGLPLLVSNLLLLTVSVSFASALPEEDLKQVQGTLGGIWVFGAIVFLNMKGSKMRQAAFATLPTVLPIILVGFSCRFLGILICMALTNGQRVCKPGCQACRLANRRAFWPDALFAFLSALPRTTMQGMHCAIPLNMGFFPSEANAREVRQQIAFAGQIYITLLAVCGVFLLDILGPRLLRLSTRLAQRHEEGQETTKASYVEGWQPRLQATHPTNPSLLSARLDPLNAFEAYQDFYHDCRPSHPHEHSHEAPTRSHELASDLLAGSNPDGSLC